MLPLDTCTHVRERVERSSSDSASLYATLASLYTSPRAPHPEHALHAFLSNYLFEAGLVESADIQFDSLKTALVCQFCALTYRGYQISPHMQSDFVVT